MRFTYNKLPPAQCKRIFGVKRRVWSYPIMWLLIFQIYSSLILNNIWSPAFCHVWIWDVWFLKRSTHDDVPGTMRGLSNPMNFWKGMWRQWSGHASIQWTFTCQIRKVDNNLSQIFFLEQNITKPFETAGIGAFLLVFYAFCTLVYIDRCGIMQAPSTIIDLTGIENPGCPECWCLETSSFFLAVWKVKSAILVKSHPFMLFLWNLILFPCVATFSC